jgi:excinuclease ABC subunit A
MRMVAGSDWVIDLGPGAGDDGGRVVAAGTPRKVSQAKGSRTAPYLAARFDHSTA